MPRILRPLADDDLAFIATAPFGDDRGMEMAENSGALWTAEEDAYVWEHLATPARDVGLDLGRTLHAVRHRRVWLRRQQDQLRA